MQNFRNPMLKTILQVEPKIPNIFKLNLTTVEPVKLSYASYESTKSPSENEVSPLIVNHGLFGSKSNWNSLCKVLHQKTQRKVIAVDSRNHGDSPHANHHSYEHLVADLKDLLDQLKVKKAALLGHSMGGRAVMLYALKYPELVERLIVVDISPITTSPMLSSIPNLFAVMQSLEMPRDMPMSAARSIADAHLSRHIPDKGLRAFLLTNLVQHLDGSFIWRVNIPVLQANFENVASFPGMDNAQFDKPVLFVAGGKSDYIQKTDHSGILKLFPKASICFIEGAGHWVHSEKPTEFLQLTVDFLNKAPSSQ